MEDVSAANNTRIKNAVPMKEPNGMLANTFGNAMNIKDGPAPKVAGSPPEKANTAGQSYKDAIYQYRTERNPKNRLFRFKAGTLVNFAMDLEHVYMTTKLDGAATFFLPFNNFLL